MDSSRGRGQSEAIPVLVGDGNRLLHQPLHGVGPGSMYTCGSTFCTTIEDPRAAQDPGIKAERRKTLSEIMEWSTYPCVLLPIWGTSTEASS